MKKIPTIFKRDFSGDRKTNPNYGKITREYADGVDWVLHGEGTPTRKYDGTSVLIRDRKMYKRYEVKEGRTVPPDFEEVDYDPETGKHVGWVQVGWGAEDKWHRESIKSGDPDKVDLPDGTYELLGPKVQGNQEHLDKHALQSHDDAEVLTIDLLGFDQLRLTLEGLDIEGIVWHHPDGRMAKIKLKDFNLKRIAQPSQGETAE